jgi:hypothetical protein
MIIFSFDEASWARKVPGTLKQMQDVLAGVLTGCVLDLLDEELSK